MNVKNIFSKQNNKKKKKLYKTGGGKNILNYSIFYHRIPIIK